MDPTQHPTAHHETYDPEHPNLPPGPNINNAQPVEQNINQTAPYDTNPHQVEMPSAEFYAPQPADGEAPRPALPPRIDDPPPPQYDIQDYARQPPSDIKDEKHSLEPPNLPARPGSHSPQPQSQPQNFPPPPKTRSSLAEDDGLNAASSPIHYTRDPKRLVAYIVPFPTPHLSGKNATEVPSRFLVYTPPPPPFLEKVAEGEKEGKVHKVQRKWLEEVRSAKTSDAKSLSWQGVKSKAVRGINWAQGQTKSSGLEFLTRVGGVGDGSQDDGHGNDGEGGNSSSTSGKSTVPLEEMVLVYPTGMGGDEATLRAEFINTMLRSKSKAQRDAIIATGLLPVSAAVDIALTLIWPFGGLLEIDATWAYASLRGAKASRSLTKRLSARQESSSSTAAADGKAADGRAGGGKDEDALRLTFTPSPRLALLQKYLASRCHDRAGDMFPYVGGAPTESTVLEAIGWLPSSKGGAERNWEDEQWEMSEVKEDLDSVMGKGAKEWVKWVRLYDENPVKAAKK